MASFERNHPDGHRRRAALPSFIAVGPPRTGTTWLHEVLKEHANLPRGNNETRFFDLHYSKGLQWYAAHFDQSSTLPPGEMCSPYFYSADARRRIAALIPDVKIICTFRDPVERVFSLYRAKRTGAIIPWNFDEALSRDPELLESSKYAFHLSQWQASFGKENVLIAIFDDLVCHPQGYVDRIVDFVGIPRFRVDARHILRVNSSEGVAAPWSFRWTRFAATVAGWLRMHRLAPLVVAVRKSALRGLVLGGGPEIPSLDPAVAARLREFFRPEIERLEAMTDRDLSAWKSRWIPNKSRFDAPATQP